MRVAVIMGSMSDYPKVEVAVEILKKFKVSVDVRCFSAHRTPDELCEFVEETKTNGTEVIIAAAGMAAARQAADKAAGTAADSCSDAGIHPAEQAPGNCPVKAGHLTFFQEAEACRLRFQ